MQRRQGELSAGGRELSFVTWVVQSKDAAMRSRAIGADMDGASSPDACPEAWQLSVPSTTLA